VNIYLIFAILGEGSHAAHVMLHTLVEQLNNRLCRYKVCLTTELVPKMIVNM